MSRLHRFTLLTTFTLTLSALAACALAPGVEPTSNVTPAVLPTAETISPGSGIEGHVLIGTACPGPVRIDSPCPDQPYQATLTVVDSAGLAVLKFETDEVGYFKIDLPPGHYRLAPQPTDGKIGPRAAEQTLIVESGQYTQITVTYDSGIR